MKGEERQFGAEGDQQEVLVEQTTMYVVLKYYNETHCFVC